MKKLFLNVIILPLLFSVELAAQDNADYSKYMEEAGSRSLIYRGKFAVRYNFVHQGSVYAYSEDYENGFVRYNGKDYYDVILNLNSNTDEVCVKRERGINDAVVLENSLVDYFFLGPRKFVNLKEGPAPMVPGFYEVIYSGNQGVKLYKKIIKFYREDISRNDSNLLLRIFDRQVQYFLVKGGEVFPIKNKRSLISLYKDRKSEIQHHLSSVTIVPTSLYTENEVLFQTILKILEK